MAITRIKICGITRCEDAVAAAELGADAIGLNFVGGPRRISFEDAFKITRELGPLVTAVGLIACHPRKYPDAATHSQVIKNRPRLPIHTFQCYGYGDGPGDFLDGDDDSSVWMVRAISDRESLRRAIEAVKGLYPRRPGAVVLDAASDKLGGSGRTFDWNWIAEARAAGELDGVPPIILAGGLRPENVAEAIRIARPYAVDVSSGVEVSGKPGVKDRVKIRDFVEAVRGA